MRIAPFGEFLDEKVYRLSGIHSSKGLVGKLMQAFKKRIAKVSSKPGDQAATLKEVNKEWKKFQRDGEKIIMTAVEKGAKDMDNVLFVTANFGNQWIAEKANGLNKEGSSLYIAYGDIQEFVINVGFKDDANGSKIYKKIDKTGMMTSPLAPARGNGVIYGDYDSGVGNNNLEIRDSEIMLIEE